MAQTMYCIWLNKAHLLSESTGKRNLPPSLSVKVKEILMCRRYWHFFLSFFLSLFFLTYSSTSPSLLQSSSLIFIYFCFLSLFWTQASPLPTSSLCLCLSMTKPNNYFFLSLPLTHCDVITLTVRSNPTGTHTLRGRGGDLFTISVVVIVLL